MPTIQLNGLSEIWPLGINNRQESSIKMGLSAFDEASRPTSCPLS